MLTEALLVVLAVSACGVAVAVLTAPVRTWLVRAGIHDAPNARSSHNVVTPRGGGVALLAVLVPAGLLGGWLTSGQAPWGLVTLMAVLAAVSFVDDVRGIAPAVRLGCQLLVVVAGLWALDPPALFPGWLPFWLERAGVAFAWLWFVNLYNFMDGIDGITAVETLAIGAGLGLIALVTGGGLADAVLPWMMAGTAAGFLWWNWAPSRIFMGDVGSVALGFALGWLLLDLAASGQPVAALILPAYYLLDATVTLLERLLRGQKFWQAHREHAYQRAVQRGLSHGAVAGRVAAANVLLLACAVWAVHGAPVSASLAAGFVSLGLWVNLRYAASATARA